MTYVTNESRRCGGRDSSMKLRSSKVAMCLGTAMVAVLMPVVPSVVSAKPTYEQQKECTQAQSDVREASYTVNVTDLVVSDTVASGYQAEVKDIYAGMAVAIAEDYCEVYENPDMESQVLGRMYQNNIGTVVEVNDEWTKISSGELAGYVNSANLCFDEEARAVSTSDEVKAVVTADTADIYIAPNGLISYATAENGEEFTALSKCGEYISVAVDSDVAYINTEHVAIDYGMELGMTNEEIEAKEEEERIAAEEAQRIAEEEARQSRIQAAMTNIEVTYNPTMTASDDEVWLLACVIDWESGWESYEGKLAVANVVLNRVRSSQYGNSITDVIYARNQFSGVSDGNGGPSSTFQARLSAGPRSSDCLKAAMAALSGENNIGNYTYFRALQVANLGAYSSYTIIGNHCFY